MNKTYIWNREYDVLVANARSLEEAIEILVQCNTSVAAFGSWAIDPYNNKRQGTYVTYDSFKEMLQNEPPIIIEPNTGLTYEHANQ